MNCKCCDLCEIDIYGQTVSYHCSHYNRDIPAFIHERNQKPWYCTLNLEEVRVTNNEDNIRGTDTQGD